MDPDVTSSGDTATYTVNVESITTEDENVKLTVSGDPNLNFDWTTQIFILLAGDTQSFGLEATVTVFTSGDYAFTVLGEAWPVSFTYEEAVQLGILETSSYTSYVRCTRAWDITGPTKWVPDGRCDMRDVALVAKLFGSIAGDGKYDARADITGPAYLVADGKIDMRDVALVVKHYGEIY